MLGQAATFEKIQMFNIPSSHASDIYVSKVKGGKATEDFLIFKEIRKNICRIKIKARFTICNFKIN